MNAKEQEALFRKIRDENPTWTPKFASGYVHGAFESILLKEPRPLYVRASETDSYAAGYVVGFLKCREAQE